MPVRSKASLDLPGLTATARVERRSKGLIPRLRKGDVAVLDHLDLDRATAQTLVDTGVVGVLNASQFLSGRYPALGPALLADAGLLLLDQVEGADRIPDGARIRVHDDVVYVDGEPVAMGRTVDSAVLADEMEQARAGLGTQLDTFTHNSAAFLRREEELLLHGEGLPSLASKVGGRPALVVVDGGELVAQLRAIRPFVKERRPVLIGVDGGAEALRHAGYAPDVVVLGTGPDAPELPSRSTLRDARDVVVRVERGDRRPVDQLERIGVRAARVETAATTEDVALLLAFASEATLIVGVGTHATLDEFLDRQRSGLASTYLTRLRVGQRLVDASAVPLLYSGRLRPRHLFLAILVGILALAAAVATTPVGQEWFADLQDWVRQTWSDLGWFA
ncbi:putative cytokinetic ring protein SteA [Nocardioides sp.]|uniref:putative cytokinetic ring protein SteA n=1 Tax=Nocardioides sp. TaxID=35761 RepID=UPI002ED64C2E